MPSDKTDSNQPADEQPTLIQSVRPGSGSQVVMPGQEVQQQPAVVQADVGEGSPAMPPLRVTEEIPIEAREGNPPATESLTVLPPLEPAISLTIGEDAGGEETTVAGAAEEAFPTDQAAKYVTVPQLQKLVKELRERVERQKKAWAPRLRAALANNEKMNRQHQELKTKVSELVNALGLDADASIDEALEVLRQRLRDRAVQVSVQQKNKRLRTFVLAAASFVVGVVVTFAVMHRSKQPDAANVTIRTEDARINVSAPPGETVEVDTKPSPNAEALRKTAAEIEKIVPK